jgi:predicted nuclease of predicted toxin-antitoxin system
VKILLDTCVWGGVKFGLESTGYDVVWSGEWEIDPGDEEILAIAYRDGRILITLDKDFGELAIVKGTTHYGIVRLVNLSGRQQAAVCLRVIELYGNELITGAIVTAELNRVRIRPPSES